MTPDVLGVMIPIVAIIFGTSVPLLGMLLEYKKRRSIYELHHRERLAAIEKGLDVPPLPVELLGGAQSRRPVAGDYLRRGLIWTFLGVAVIAALHLEQEPGAYYGLIPTAIGVAHLVYYVVHARAAGAPDSGGST